MKSKCEKCGIESNDLELGADGALQCKDRDACFTRQRFQIDLKQGADASKN